MTDGSTRRSLPLRALRLALASCVVLAVGLVLSVSAAQASAAGGKPTVAMAVTKAPEVGYQDASHVSTTGATIEVPINPEGGETSWEIWLECQNAPESNHSCEPLTVGPQRQEGILPPGFEPQIVTDAVTGLQPGYSYSYGVIATNSAGRAGVLGDGFVTCPSQGPCASQRYMPGLPLWVIEGTAKVAAELTAKEQAERKTKEQYEQEERQSQEAPLKLVLEREEREAAEAEAAASTPSVVECVVPSLRGDSLSKAQRALSKAHCKLGKVSKPEARHHGRLVVTQQRVGAGGKLPSGTRIGVTLGRAVVQENAHARVSHPGTFL
jgi:hypothetical protein